MSSEALGRIWELAESGRLHTWDIRRASDGHMSAVEADVSPDVLALLAEVARLEQDRDDWQRWAETVETPHVEVLRADLAVARERAEQAERLLQQVKLWPLSTEPIPPKDLQRASQLARERGWDKLPGTADPLRTALAQRDEAREREQRLRDLLEEIAEASTRYPATPDHFVGDWEDLAEVARAALVDESAADGTAT